MSDTNLKPDAPAERCAHPNRIVGGVCDLTREEHNYLESLPGGMNHTFTLAQPAQELDQVKYAPWREPLAEPPRRGEPRTEDEAQGAGMSERTFSQKLDTFWFGMGASHERNAARADVEAHVAALEARIAELEQDRERLRTLEEIQAQLNRERQGRIDVESDYTAALQGTGLVCDQCGNPPLGYDRKRRVGTTCDRHYLNDDSCDGKYVAEPSQRGEIDRMDELAFALALLDRAKLELSHALPAGKEYSVARNSQSRRHARTALEVIEQARYFAYRLASQCGELHIITPDGSQPSERTLRAALQAQESIMRVAETLRKAIDAAMAPEAKDASKKETK